MNTQHKRALVTGATDGIGRETALKLAREGFSVCIVGRSADKGLNIVRRVQQEGGSAEFLQADFSLVREVRRVSEIVHDRWDTLNVLVHSAGVFPTGKGITPLTTEHLEASYVVNYLSRFVLTNELLPLLEAAGTPEKKARIVTIAASSASAKTLDIDTIAEQQHLAAKGMARLSYAQASNDVFTLELSRRLQGKPINAVALMPGMVSTDLRVNGGFPRWAERLMGIIAAPLVMNPEQGSEAPFYLATSPDVEDVSGALFTKMRQLKHIKTSPMAANEALGKRLWEVSERLSRSEQEVIPSDKQ